MIRFGSVCSGIEAASEAWEPLGWQPQFFAEIEPFPAAVLHHHYSSGRPRNMPSPDEEGLTPRERKARMAAIRAVQDLPKRANGVPNYGDFTSIGADAGPIDLLVGGTPCQTFSIAGKRLGLDDPRGNLALEHVRLAKRLNPRWFVWENVPGVFTSGGGRDFADFLGLLTGRRIKVPKGGWRNAGIVAGLSSSYGIAWRVLDAQYVRVDGYTRAVPQRRKRVIVVGYLGDWRRAAAVLFEPEGMRGDPAPRRQAGKAVAAPIASGSPVGSGYRNDADTAENLVAGTVTAKWSRGTGGPAGDEVQNLVAHTLRGEGFDASEDGSGRGAPLIVAPAVAASLTRGADSAGKGGYAGRRQEDDSNIVVMPIDTTQVTSVANGSNPDWGDPCHSLAKEGHAPAVAFSGQDFTIRETDVAQPLMAAGPTTGSQGGDYLMNGVRVRRLMPPECARLQGFKDDRCRIPWKRRPIEQCPDGPQYKAFGNSMAVNVMRWIGMRIDLIERLEAEGRIA